MNKDIAELIDNCPLKAIGYHLILKIEESEIPEEKTTNGIIINIKQTKDVRLTEVGYVLNIGTIAFGEIGGSESVGVKEGDRVIFAKHGGQVKKINGIDYRIINDTDVVAVVLEDAIIC